MCSSGLNQKIRSKKQAPRRSTANTELHTNAHIHTSTHLHAHAKSTLAPQFRPPALLVARTADYFESGNGLRMCDAWFVADSSQPQGLERTQDMHNGTVAPRSHILAAGITQRAPLFFGPRQAHACAIPQQLCSRPYAHRESAPEVTGPSAAHTHTHTLHSHALHESITKKTRPLTQQARRNTAMGGKAHHDAAVRQGVHSSTRFHCLRSMSICDGFTSA